MYWYAWLPSPRCQRLPAGSGQASISSPAGRLPLGTARLAPLCQPPRLGAMAGAAEPVVNGKVRSQGQPIPDAGRETGEMDRAVELPLAVF